MNQNYLYPFIGKACLGCDTVAHEATLMVNGKTIAVLPSPCDNPQPTVNKALAEKIVENGGLLISEYSTVQRFLNTIILSEIVFKVCLVQLF